MSIIEGNSVLKARRYSKKDYDGVTFDNCVLYKCVFKLCTFSGGNFYYCTLVDCDFSDFNFYWVGHLRNAFVSCNFTDVKFCGIDLTDVTFVNCTFTRTQFRPSNLGGGCDLKTTHFVDCEFKNCVSLNSKIDDENPLPEQIQSKNMDIEDIGLM